MAQRVCYNVEEVINTSAAIPIRPDKAGKEISGKGGVALASLCVLWLICKSLLGLTLTRMLMIVSLMLTQIPSVSLRWFQACSIPLRCTQSRSDSISLTVIDISLRCAHSQSDSCNLTQIRSASSSITQIRSESPYHTQSCSDSVNLVQVYLDPFSCSRSHSDSHSPTVDSLCLPQTH